MTDALDPSPGQKVLEIGTGSGYQSALLSQLTREVYTIEIVKPLAEETNRIYAAHTAEMPRLAEIHRRIADGYYGWAKEAPFDRIIVTAGIDHIPPDLLRQLKPGGRMVIPVGPPSGQTLLEVTKEVGKDGKINLVRTDIYHAKVTFLPLSTPGGGTHDTNNSRENRSRR
jgi:protein-L-isoaspartate(D-aspartate) O-methyltransferase